MPGGGGSVVVGLRNQGPGTGIATLRINDVLNLEVTCSSNEAPVDTTCQPPNPGEMADDVRLTISARKGHSGGFTSLFGGTVGDLGNGLVAEQRGGSLPRTGGSWAQPLWPPRSPSGGASVLVLRRSSKR